MSARRLYGSAPGEPMDYVCMVCKAAFQSVSLSPGFCPMCGSDLRNPDGADDERQEGIRASHGRIFQAGIAAAAKLRPVTRSNASVIGPVLMAAAQALENSGSEETSAA